MKSIKTLITGLFIGLRWETLLCERIQFKVHCQFTSFGLNITKPSRSIALFTTQYALLYKSISIHLAFSILKHYHSVSPRYLSVSKTSLYKVSHFHPVDNAKKHMAN